MHVYSMRRLRLLAPALAAALTIALGGAGAAAAQQQATAAGSPAAAAAEGGIPGVRSSMAGGNTVGDQVREAKPRSDGYRHIDTKRLIAELKDLHATNYLYQVWGSKTDWQDLRDEFAPAAAKAGIEVWVYIVPPTECAKPYKCSYPYETDYVAWSRAIAKLSTRYPNVVGWAIDDFSAGGNPQTFNPDYMQRIKAAADAFNPDLALYTTAYYDGATSDAFLAKYAPYIDGIFFPYVDTVSSPTWREQLHSQVDEVVRHARAHGLDTYFMNYTGRQLGSAIDESPEDVAGILGELRPYLADGRLAGLISYGTPMDLDTPEISSQDKARTGIGRLSLSDFGMQTAGHWASGRQRVAVEPGQGSYSVSFYDYDQFGDEVPGARGIFSKQLLVDGEVVWSEDLTDDPMDAWEKHTVDITDEVAGKGSVDLAFRLYENSVAYTPTDFGIDDLTATGLNVRNGGFESREGWQLESNAGHVKPRIDLWAQNQPRRLFDAVAQQYATLAGDEAPEISKPITNPPANLDAMYGKGRLSLSLGYWKQTKGGQCATATQRVPVDTHSPRYELGFWQYDQWWPTYPGYHFKKVLIDGVEIYSADVADSPANTWINGYQLSGDIDVTAQVKGKSSVELTFALCEAAGVVNYPVDVGFDNLTSVGLDIEDPGFDGRGGWDFHGDGSLEAGIDRS